MATLATLRSDYHGRLSDGLLCWRKKGVLNIADRSSDVSIAISKGIAERISRRLPTTVKVAQTLGSRFGEITKDFLDAAFAHLLHVRPGDWVFSTSQAREGIGAYTQYAHLLEVQRILNENPELKTALGGDYLVTPDILVGRRPLSDEEISGDDEYLKDATDIACQTPLRASNREGSPLILHASISCKWTIRSDRAQNTRTEALNLIRNRKGNTPHIVVVTFEPLPTRLASIAMGTGDVDCMYHAALPELKAAVGELEKGEQAEVLANLIDGQRLRDISDLPLDLAV